MRILAVDPATRSGWAVGSPGEKAVYGTITMPKRPVLGERLLFLLNRLRELIIEHRPDLIVAEEPFMPHDQSQWATVQLGQKIEGCVLMAAAEAGLPIETYTPAAWRLDFIGFGRAPRGATANFMKVAVRERLLVLGYRVANSDESDALGLLLAALHGRSAAARAQGDLLARASEGL